MHLVQFFTPAGAPAYINPEQVVAVSAGEADGFANVQTTNGLYQVRGTVEHVAKWLAQIIDFAPLYCDSEPHPYPPLHDSGPNEDLAAMGTQIKRVIEALDRR